VIMADKRVVKVTVDGKAYDVAFEDLSASPMSVTVNGKVYTVEVEQPAAAPVQVVAAKPAAPAPVATAAPKPAPVAPVAPPPAPVAGEGFQIVAPMPGKIVSVSVRVGQSVKYGQELCGLEAMKMKNAIRAPKDGVVKSIHITEGQKVAHGTPMIVLE